MKSSIKKYKNESLNLNNRKGLVVKSLIKRKKAITKFKFKWGRKQHANFKT